MKEIRIVEEKRREKLIKEKKIKQEKMLRQEQEKRERLRMKTMLESRWEMARWITEYISENEETWRKEKIEREKNHQTWMMSWAKKSRFEKIKEIKENQKETDYQQKMRITVSQEKLTPALTPTQPDQPQPHQTDPGPAQPLPTLCPWVTWMAKMDQATLETAPLDWMSSLAKRMSIATNLTTLQSMLITCK